MESKKVLAITKDDWLANMIRAILNILDIQIIHSRAGVDAEEVLEEENIGLVIADHMLTDMTGRDFLKFLRENDATSQIPLIMMVKGDYQKADENDKYQPDEYIFKPLEARNVMEVIRKFVVVKDN